MSDPSTVNPHYLDHVVGTTASHVVEVTEDIVSGSGIKLLAKGARIDPAVRERLLAHKLRKPLEDCLQVADGVRADELPALAEQLQQTWPALEALSRPPDGTASVATSLGRLSLSGPVRSLLTVYARSRPGRLEHAVGVAMLALSLGRRLAPGEFDRHRDLALAGLLHDVGELYLDPAHLAAGGALPPDHWRQIVSHPLIGHRVLRHMDGAGPVVARSVLQHHERLDGLGYPQGLAGADLPLDGQVLGVAEWLMGLLSGGISPLLRAKLASCVVPGEFSTELLQAVAAARFQADGLPPLAPQDGALQQQRAVARAERIAACLRRFRDQRPWIDERVAQARGPLQRALQAAVQRLERLQLSFVSAGLEIDAPRRLVDELVALGDAALRQEISQLLGEMEFRLRALERECLARTGLLPPDDHRVMQDVVARLRDDAPDDAAHDAAQDAPAPA
ncbi:HD domain-containing phosphohydrolase [Ideonella sp.]|uniref:HD domain-containing phosphohydrolase n=1 Tax=Ideonella sp. TaxID=1929293 RepID=UPI0035B339AC